MSDHKNLVGSPEFDKDYYLSLSKYVETDFNKFQIDQELLKFSAMFQEVCESTTAAYLKFSQAKNILEEAEAITRLNVIKQHEKKPTEETINAMVDKDQLVTEARNRVTSLEGDYFNWSSLKRNFEYRHSDLIEVSQVLRTGMKSFY